MSTEKLIRDFIEAEHSHRRNLRPKDDNGAGRVLKFIAAADGQVHPSDLCEKMKVSLPRITNILNDMETKGLIKREISPDDRRKIIVTLTDEGRKAIEERRTRNENEVRKLIELVGESDIEAYIRVLKAREQLALSAMAIPAALGRSAASVRDEMRPSSTL